MQKKPLSKHNIDVGKGAPYELFKYGPDRDYDDHCSSAAAFDCSGNDNNGEHSRLLI